MRITVFTPTYNRGYCLKRLFITLQEQTFKNFEWVVVDDGSTDNTENLIATFKEKAQFPIKYRKTSNGGKHRAINRGIDMAEGELLLFMDSDDWLREDALEWIDKVENTIPTDQKDKYAGVQGLRCHTDGKIIGSTFDGEYLDSTTIERKHHKILGDKAECYYTHLIRKYPFPEFEGEKFATERLVWNQIAAEGKKVRYFNEGIYFCEYLEDGLTHKGNLLYANNPKQWALAIHQDYQYQDMNWYNTSIQIFIYYLHEREKIGLNTIVKYLDFPKLSIIMAILLQEIMEIFRFIIGKGKTIKKGQRL